VISYKGKLSFLKCPSANDLLHLIGNLVV